MSFEEAVTFFFAFVATIMLLQLLQPMFKHFDLVDVPNERSSHTRPVLRGGGLAIALGTSAALVISGTAGGVTAVALLIVTAGFAALGFADDFESRSVELRLSTQAALAALAAGLLVTTGEYGPVLTTLAAAAGTIWIITFVNIFNFMDGINGISAATALIVGAVHIVLGSQLDASLLTIAGAALLGGALGFLPFNFPVARVFAGDVGSYFLGSYIAILSIIALMAGASAITVVAPLAVYLLDTTSTLVRRALSGKSIFKSHREHSYQHLANGRLSHTSTTAVVALITSVSAGIGLLAHNRSAAVSVACLLAIIALSTLFVWLPRILVDRKLVPQAAR